MYGCLPVSTVYKVTVSLQKVFVHIILSYNMSLIPLRKPCVFIAYMLIKVSLGGKTDSPYQFCSLQGCL